MRIGLTYDLRKDYLEKGFSEEQIAEFDSEETIQALSRTIRDLGHKVDPIGNIYTLARRLCSGENWDLVFNICEGLFGRSREAQVPALLEAFRVHYTFSDPLTLALTLDKAVAKQVVRDAGLATPDFFTVESAEEAGEAGQRNPLSFPLFAKPISEGTGKGITPASIIRSRQDLVEQCTRLLDRYHQPVLVEEYLPGREFTVGIVGTGKKARTIGVMEVKLLDKAEPGVYSYLNKELCEQHVLYQLTLDPGLTGPASALALGAYRALGCRDAGRVDLRADAEGRLCFLEVNPLAGLHPTHSDLPILSTKAGWAYSQLIKEIIASALEREPLGAGAGPALQAMLKVS